MWKTEHSIETSARPKALWGLLVDAEGWPSWNPGLASAHLDGPLRNGTTGRTTQASGQQGKFMVTAVQEGSHLVNEAKVPGAVLRFQHTIETLDPTRTRITLGATLEGPMAPIWRLIFGRTIAGYMPTAVRQLAARAEGTGVAPADGKDQET